MNSRVLIFGSRDWTNRDVIECELRTLDPHSIIIEGEARGADTIAKEIALYLGMDVRGYAAEWTIYGLSAGPRRNARMIAEGKPTQAIGFHNDIAHSKGSKDMLNKLIQANIPVRIVSE